MYPRRPWGSSRTRGAETKGKYGVDILIEKSDNNSGNHNNTLQTINHDLTLLPKCDQDLFMLYNTWADLAS